MSTPPVEELPLVDKEQKQQKQQKLSKGALVGLIIGAILIGALVLIMAVVLIQKAKEESQVEGIYRCAGPERGCVLYPSSTCNPRGDINCFVDQPSCASYCLGVAGFNCPGPGKACQVLSSSQCFPEEEGGCDVKDLDDCELQCKAETPTHDCNVAGTRSVTEQGTCYCWEGVTGAKCDSCIAGRGPQFPCCTMTSLPLLDPNDPKKGLAHPCYSHTFQTHWDGEKKALYRGCDTPEAGCFSTPSYNPLAGDHSGAYFGKQAKCESWVNPTTGVAINFLDYPTYESYLDDFEQRIASGLLVPGGIYCTQKGYEKVMDSGNNGSREAYEECASRSQLNSCTLTGSNNAPLAHFIRNDGSFVIETPS